MALAFMLRARLESKAAKSSGAGAVMLPMLRRKGGWGGRASNHPNGLTAKRCRRSKTTPTPAFSTRYKLRATRFFHSLLTTSH